MSGTLYIVATPLGNLADLTPRAQETLRQVQLVCAEDTRVTGKLLSACSIEKPLLRVDESRIGAEKPKLLERLAQGEDIAYCSDAGMPGVSDPGMRLIDAAYEAHLPVSVIPGATAVTTAYVASGFLCPQFYFGGFFPRKDAERTRVLNQLESLEAVQIFYESPKRIVSALDFIARTYPARRCAVARELTKRYEEVLRGSAQELANILREREAQGLLKGEFVLLIDTASQEEREVQEESALFSAEARALELRHAGNLKTKEIVKALQAEFGISRNQAYELATAPVQTDQRSHD